MVVQKETALNSGYKIPTVGLGTWQSTPGEIKDVVKIALGSGYRHFDCAQAYGNEAEIGEALEVFLIDIFAVMLHNDLPRSDT